MKKRERKFQFAARVFYFSNSNEIKHLIRKQKISHPILYFELIHLIVYYYSINQSVIQLAATQLCTKIAEIK